MKSPNSHFEPWVTSCLILLSFYFVCFFSFQKHILAVLQAPPLFSVLSKIRLPTRVCHRAKICSGTTKKRQSCRVKRRRRSHLHIKAKVLLLFKEEIKHELPDEVWVQRVIDYFCPTELEERQRGREHQCPADAGRWKGLISCYCSQCLFLISHMVPSSFTRTTAVISKPYQKTPKLVYPCRASNPKLPPHPAVEPKAHWSLHQCLIFPVLTDRTEDHLVPNTFPKPPGGEELLYSTLIQHMSDLHGWARSSSWRH